MQQKNLTNTVHGQSVRHEVRGLALTSRWVVDSKPLVLGKHNMTIAHAGCDNACGAPAVDQKN